MASTTRNAANASQKLTDSPSTSPRSPPSRPRQQHEPRPGDPVAARANVGSCSSCCSIWRRMRCSCSESGIAPHHRRFAAIPQRASDLDPSGSVARMAPSWSGPHCWAPRRTYGPAAAVGADRHAAGRPDRGRAEALADAVDGPAGVAPAPGAPARRPVGRRRPGRRSAAARPAAPNFDADTPSRRTPAARSICREQRAGGARRWRRRVSTAPASVVARVIVRNPPSRTFSVTVRGADAVGAQAGGDGVGQPDELPARRRRGRGGRGRTSPRGRSTWPPGPVSTGRSSMPLARSMQVPAVGPAERADHGAAGSRAARSPTVATPSRREALERRRARRPTAGRPGAGGGTRAPRPGATSTTPRPGPTPSGVARGLAATDASLARNLFGATPTEHVRSSSSRTAARDRRGDRRRRRRAGARAPVTSRNASSSESGSTSGVTAREDGLDLRG